MKTIKPLTILLLLLMISATASANFISAKLKVTGVTCSMCSNSVHKALSALTFVEKIDVDLQNAVFELSFKSGERVIIDDIRKKVEQAGFSVGELIADFNFQKLNVTNDYHFEFEGNMYHFVNINAQVLNNKIPVRFVDKGLTTTKEHKKYTGLTAYACIKTAKSETCCKTKKQQRIYHITL